MRVAVQRLYDYAGRYPAAAAGAVLLVASVLMAGAQLTGDIGSSLAAIVLGVLFTIGVVILLRRASPSESEPANERTILWALLIIGVLLQIGHWYVDGGAISAKTGDDDEIYIFIGQQIAGLIEGPPLFTIRPPGVPLLVAGTLSGSRLLTGEVMLWPLSLIQRLMLALTPLLLYLILRNWLPRSFAVLGALLYLATPIHEHKAEFALSEMPYTFGTLVALVGVWMAVRGRSDRRVWWLLLAALALAFKTSLRVTGIASAGALAIAVVLMAVDWTPIRRAGAAALLVLPSALVIGWIIAYNGQTTGEASISELGGLNVIRHFAPRLEAIDDSEETALFAELVPEPSRDDLFRTATLWTVARYRAALQGDESLHTFTQASDALSSQIIRTHPLAYGQWVLMKFYTDMMYPRVEAIPFGWYRPELTDLLTSVDFELPTPRCKPAWSSAITLIDRACQLDADARAQTVFEPDLPAIPGILTQAIRFLTVSLIFRMRLVSWVFYWGAAGAASVIWLVVRSDTRQVGWLLGAAFGAEFLPLMIVAPVSTQYQILYHPIYALAIWIALGVLARISFPLKPSTR